MTVRLNFGVSLLLWCGVSWYGCDVDPPPPGVAARLQEEPAALSATARPCEAGSSCDGDAAVARLAAAQDAAAPAAMPTVMANSGASGADLPDPKKRYLRTFKEVDVRAAAARSDVDASKLRWHIVEWKERPNTLLAASYVPAAPGLDPKQTHASVAVIEKRGSTLQQLTSLALPLDDAQCACAIGDQPCDGELEIKLDRTKYALTSNRAAFGVRMTCPYEAPGAHGIATHFALFELYDDALRQLLTAYLGGTGYDRVASEQYESRATLQVQHTRHAGYTDLMLKTRSLRRRDPSEDAPRARSKPKRSTEKQLFVWNGERYVEDSGRATRDADQTPRSPDTRRAAR